MSTFTSSAFLERKFLHAYKDGKYLLSASGPYLEKFSMDQKKSRKRDEKVKQPIRVRVLEYGTIECILPQNRTDHVILISTMATVSERNIVAKLLNSNRLVTGGYAPRPSDFTILTVSNHPDAKPLHYLAAAIPDSDEFVIIIDKNLKRSRCVTTEDAFEIVEVDDHDILEGAQGEYEACYIAPTANYELVMRRIDAVHRVSRFMVFLFFDGEKFTPRHYQAGDGKILLTAVTISSLDLSIVCGLSSISLLSKELPSRKEGRRNAPPAHIGYRMKEIARVPVSRSITKQLFTVTEETGAIVYAVANEGFTVCRVTSTTLEILQDVVLHQLLRNPTVENQDSDWRLVQMELRIHDNDELLYIVRKREKYDEVVASAVVQKKSNGIKIAVSYQSGAIRIFKIENVKYSNVPSRGKYPAKPLLPSSVLYKAAYFPYASDAVHLLPHKDDSESHLMNMIAWCGPTIEHLHLNGKGSLTTVSTTDTSIEVSGPQFQIQDTDAVYVRQTDSIYVAAAFFNGTIHVKKCDNASCPNSSWTILTDIASNSFVHKLLLYKDSQSDQSPRLFVVLTEEYVRIYDLDYNAGKIDVLYEDSLQKSGSKYKIVTMGDGRAIQDLWILHRRTAKLIVGRNGTFTPVVAAAPRNFAGALTAVSSMTSRTRGSSERYLDVTCVGTKSGAVGVVAALQTESQPAERIHFIQWPIERQSEEVCGIQTEIVDFDGMSQQINMRVYVIGPDGFIHASIGRLIVESAGMRTAEVSKLFCLRTDISSPTAFVLRTMHPLGRDDEDGPPKFAIVSGRAGSQVIRICPRLLDPSTPWAKRFYVVSG